MRDDTRFNYAKGTYIRASCEAVVPKHIPKCDIIRLVLDKGKRGGGRVVDCWFKIDEAMAIAAALASAAWRAQVRFLAKQQAKRRMRHESRDK